MGRISTVERMPLEQRLILESAIRRHKYADIDRIARYITELGIRLSRSALGRHVQTLRELDYRLASTDNTVVLLVERSSGKTLSLATSLDINSVAALIENQTLHR